MEQKKQAHKKLFEQEQQVMDNKSIYISNIETHLRETVQVDPLL